MDGIICNLDVCVRCATCVELAVYLRCTCTACVVKGCDGKCKVPGANRGPCCDEPGCDMSTVDFDSRAMLNNPKAINNLGGYGPDKDSNNQLTVDGGSLAKEMRFPEAGSFVDTENLNGVPDAVIVFDLVITVIGESASGRKAGVYQPKTPSINGIYTNSNYDVGDKADLIAINFGQ